MVALRCAIIIIIIIINVIIITIYEKKAYKNWWRRQFPPLDGRSQVRQDNDESKEEIGWQRGGGE